METDQNGDQGDNLRQQVQHFDELLEEQQIALRDFLASPPRANDEDDDLADELEDLVRSEELLRKELTMLRGNKPAAIEQDTHEAIDTINSSPKEPQAPKDNRKLVRNKQEKENNLRERNDQNSSHEEHGIVFYRDGWDDELFRGNRKSDPNHADEFEGFLSHHNDGYDEFDETGWNNHTLAPLPANESPDKSKTELDMMLAINQSDLPAVEEDGEQIINEDRQRRIKADNSFEKGSISTSLAATVQSNMNPTVTPQKERVELNKSIEDPSFTTAFSAKTPSPTKTYSISMTPESTEAPTPTRAPSPLKNTPPVAKLWFGKPTSRPSAAISPTPGPPAMKRSWFSRKPSPAKTGGSIALPDVKTPPSKSAERENQSQSGVSTPTLVSILQSTMTFNPLERHHEQVLGSLVLSPENIVFESSSDDDSCEKSIDARKNLDSVLEEKALPITSSTIASGDFQDAGNENGPKTSPLIAFYPEQVLKSSDGDRELPQRWSPASSSPGSKSASPDGRNTDYLETDYVRATPEELYPEFEFYATKPTRLEIVVATNDVKQASSEDASCVSPVHSSSGSTSYESAIQASTASASFETLPDNEVPRSKETRSIGSGEDHVTKNSSSASQSFVTAVDDLPFSSNASMRTISSGDASHATYATAREQEEPNFSLVKGELRSIGDIDSESNSVEDGGALVESVSAPVEKTQKYRNSDSDSETSQSRVYVGYNLSCVEVVKQLLVSPIAIVFVLLVIMATVGLSIRLIIEATTTESSAMLTPGGNVSAPTLSPSHIQPSPMPVSSTKPTTPSQNASHTPILRPTHNPTLAPVSEPTATPASAATLVPTGSPTMNPSIAPTQRPTTESTIRQTLYPTREPVSAAPSVVLSDLMNFLSSVSFDKGGALRNTSTPQYAAYEWLSSNTFLPTYSNDRLIQRYSLATFYYSSNGDGWSQKTGWLSDDDECGWYTRSNVSPCDPLGFIVTLGLDYNDIGGTIPPELGLLSNLKLIDLGGGPNQQLSGSLPKQIGNLKNLEKLLFRMNRLTGTIPTEICTLENVDELRLKGNYFRGTIPTEISNMRNARIVDLSDNMLVGDIPSGIGNLIGLQSLFLDHNNFEGALPSEIKNLVALQTLSLAGNRLTGVPVQIGSLLMLTTLHLDRNEIAGSITSGIHQLSNLRYLTMSGNLLNSTIPSELGSLKNLNELDLSLNELTGIIPGEIGEINSRLRVVKLNGNQLTGTIPEKFSHLDRINTLALHDNLLTGTVPYTVCRVFEWIIPTFSVDCEEVTCPCCNFCCDEENGCTCLYKGIEEEWRCY